MTEQQMTTPEEDLAELERRAIDGEPVTAGELASARERVTLAALVEQGTLRRAEEARRRVAAAAREQARLDAAAALAELDADLDEAVADVARAVARVRSAVDVRNEKIRNAATILDRAGFPGPDRNKADTLDVEGIDTAYYPRWDYGMELRGVRVADQDFAVAPATMRVRAAVGAAVAEAKVARTVEFRD